MKGVSFKKKEKLSDRTGGVTIMQTATKKETALGIRQMAMIGVMTAVTCIAAPFSIPIPVSPVPLSLTTFILYLSVYILGTRNAFISYVIYLLLGLVGLPVFSGFSGGFAKLAGPTGGYLIGFLFMIPLTGILFDIIGVAVTAADEVPFHAMASRKVRWFWERWYVTCLVPYGFACS